MKCLASVISTLSLIGFAWAHGYVKEVRVNNGEPYIGRVFGSGATDGVVRVITTFDPNLDVTNPNINCGNGAVPVTDFVDADPGDEVTFEWDAGGGETWPHIEGPLMNYMAHCTNGDCTTFDSTEAQWFKISQVGLEDGQWIQARLHEGALARTTIPDGISPGQYLFRHEIISLHLSGDREGPEFYPSCIQFKIGGNGSGEAAESDLVKFPGGYEKDDPGFDNIYDHQYENPEDKYQFPGPKIASFIYGGNADDDDNTTVPDGQSTSTGTSTSSSYSATSTPSYDEGEDEDGEGDWDDENTPTVSDSDQSTSTATPTGSTSSPSSTSTSCNRLKKMKKRAPMLNGSLYTPTVAKRADAFNRSRHVSLMKRTWQRISA